MISRVDIVIIPFAIAYRNLSIGFLRQLDYFIKVFNDSGFSRYYRYLEVPWRF